MNDKSPSNSSKSSADDSVLASELYLVFFLKVIYFQRLHEKYKRYSVTYIVSTIMKTS